MQLWQLDQVGSCFRADRREVKIVTGSMITPATA
jgi:hypothetical protein